MTKLHEYAARADAGLFWPVRLQLAVGGIGRSGVVLLAAVILALMAVEHPGGIGAVLHTADATVLGEALFFGVSLALLLEFAGYIPRAAQNDLAALHDQLSLDAAERTRLKAALTRMHGSDTLLLGGVGASLGILHSWLSGDIALEEMRVNGFAVATIILWSLMFQTGGVLVANAQLFAALGSQAAKVEPLSMRRLHPLVQAALRPMLLISSLLAAYPLMLLGTPGWGASTLVGPVATLALALVAVWLPLRGLARSMRMTRDRALDRIEDELSNAWAELERDPRTGDRLEMLLALRDRLVKAPVYPLTFSGFWRAVLYLALPLATWSGKGLGEAVLERFFGAGF
ncbi:MAG: hypothetical protein ACXIVF_18010 [Rhizobiaceae bacterium]